MNNGKWQNQVKYIHIEQLRMYEFQATLSVEYKKIMSSVKMRLHPLESLYYFLRLSYKSIPSTLFFTELESLEYGTAPRDCARVKDSQELGEKI